MNNDYVIRMANQIADALGISQGSVKTHAHRALAALAARREELT